MEAPRHIRLIMVTIIKGEIDSKTVTVLTDVNTSTCTNRQITQTKKAARKQKL